MGVNIIGFTVCKELFLHWTFFAILVYTNFSFKDSLEL